MSKSGRFLTIEGGEGVGKSLFLAALGQALKDRAISLVTTREPGGTPSADRIRALFAAPPANDPLLMVTEALLVSAARAQHVGRLIRPALESGTWVLCDRFTDSMRVYQGLIGGVMGSDIEALIAFSTRQTAPDLTFVLDCDVSIVLERLKRRRNTASDAPLRYDRGETTFHQRLREGFLALSAKDSAAGKGRMVVLEATTPVEALVSQALQIIEARFGTF